MKVRPLKDTDYDRGFLQLLSQLTHVGNVTRTQFLSMYRRCKLPLYILRGFLFTARFSQMKASGDYYVTVIEDTRKNQIIGAASLIIERKFIHNCAVVSQESSPVQYSYTHSYSFTLQRGRLEDVVVNDTYRGKQLGKL